MLSELATLHIRCCLLAIPSDLMKSTVVDESLSSMNQEFCSRENQLLQLLQQNEISTSIFDVCTDNNPLTYVLTTAKLDAMGHRWITGLANYNFHIHY